MAHNMNLETARKILIDILKAIALPENSKKLSEAKCKKFDPVPCLNLIRLIWFL